MCGIVGILGQEPVAWKLVDALKRLEYRGYDSAGIAVLADGKMERVWAPGKLEAMSLAEMERRHILATLNANDWNKSRTSSVLGIERSTLDRKIRRYGLAGTE